VDVDVDIPCVGLSAYTAGIFGSWEWKAAGVLQCSCDVTGVAVQLNHGLVGVQCGTIVVRLSFGNCVQHNPSGGCTGATSISIRNSSSFGWTYQLGPTPCASFCSSTAFTYYMSCGLNCTQDCASSHSCSRTASGVVPDSGGLPYTASGEADLTLTPGLGTCAEVDEMLARVPGVDLARRPVDVLRSWRQRRMDINEAEEVFAQWN